MGVYRSLLGLALFLGTFKESAQGPNEVRLIKYLMSGYSSMVRPVQNDSDTLTVEFGLSLMQIMDVDEKNQVLTTNIWLHMKWDDYSLQWDPEEYPGVQSLKLPGQMLWKPDILLYNSADERFDATFKTNILVKNTGMTIYIPPALQVQVRITFNNPLLPNRQRHGPAPPAMTGPANTGIFKSTCKIDVRWFPFDEQRCEMKFGSWVYDGLALDLKMTEADLSGYTANGEWDLVAVPGKKTDNIYPCCPEPYPDITYTVVMRRRTIYYGLNLLTPCILISTLALLVFLLPVDSGEKISLGITVLLSLTVFMLLVAEIMPATSDSVPLIAQYFATVMIIVGLSVIATVLVLQFHHHDPNGSKMPKWTRVFLLNWCANFLGMKRPGEDKSRSDCTHKEMETAYPTPGPHNNTSNMLYVSFRGLDSNPNSTAVTSPDSGVMWAKPPHSGEPELNKILDELSYIAKRFRDKDEEEIVCNDWKFAASVIDRLCLIVFSIFTILCTICILMSAPNFADDISKDLLKN